MNSTTYKLIQAYLINPPISRLPFLTTPFGAVCDPVMGDEGKLYLPPDMVPLFRTALLPLANVLTPNCFEAELLTGLTITDDVSAVAACNALHERGPHTVVCT